jgi:uncharacterized protein
MRRLTIFGWLVALAVLVAVVPVRAGPFEDGLEAMKSGDFALTLELWRPLADQGNVRAQTYMGFMYEDGRGVPRDYQKAMEWYRLAAAQGYEQAHNTRHAGAHGAKPNV